MIGLYHFYMEYYKIKNSFVHIM